MTTPVATVQINLSGLQRFSAQVDAGLRDGNGPFKAMYEQWAARYRGFVQERFDTYSKGGGDWKPLKYRRKHKRGAKERQTILRDTNTMFRALNPTFQGQPGALQQHIPYGVEVGFGGSAIHPKTEGKITVAELARIHHLGLGKVPARPIMVDAPQKVIDAMTRDAERALARVQDAQGSS